MSPEEREARKAQVVAMRRAGFSRSQICRALGLKSGGRALDRWLKDVPPPEWTKRPRARDDLREKAVMMRREGRSYREIKEFLGVSKSSLSLWLRDVPLTEEHRYALIERRLAGAARAASTLRARRVARERRIVREAAAQVAGLAESELFVAGVVAYWAEGSKNKPWGPRRSMDFANSDPRMILLFLAWLRLLGIPDDAVAFRVSIHESADVDGAIRFWSRAVAVPLERFQRTTLKRHNPRTNRKNTGDGYSGCLTVRVRRSADLNNRVQGWFEGIVANLPEPDRAY